MEFLSGCYRVSFPSLDVSLQKYESTERVAAKWGAGSKVQQQGGSEWAEIGVFPFLPFQTIPALPIVSACSI